MKKLILLILLIPSLLFAGPLQQAHKKVIASLTVAGEGGDGALGQSSQSDYVYNANDTRLYYTEFTATAGDVENAHILLQAVGGNGTNVMIYLFESDGTYVNSWESAALWVSTTWINIAMGSTETLTASSYLLGVQVEDDSGYNIGGNTGTAGIYYITHTYGAVTDIIPGNATESSAVLDMTIFLNNTVGNP